MYQRRLAVDDRDPRTTWQPVALSTLPAMLPGLEFGWQPPGVPEEVQKAMRERAEGIWLSQKTRWTQDKVLTARADFSLTQAPGTWKIPSGEWLRLEYARGRRKYYPGWRR